MHPDMYMLWNVNANRCADLCEVEKSNCKTYSRVDAHTSLKPLKNEQLEVTPLAGTLTLQYVRNSKKRRER